MVSRHLLARLGSDRHNQGKLALHGPKVTTATENGVQYWVRSGLRRSRLGLLAKQDYRILLVSACLFSHVHNLQP